MKVNYQTPVMEIVDVRFVSFLAGSDDYGEEEEFDGPGGPIDKDGEARYRYDQELRNQEYGSLW